MLRVVIGMVEIGFDESCIQQHLADAGAAPKGGAIEVSIHVGFPLRSGIAPGAASPLNCC